MLVDRIQVFTQRLIHARKGLAHLDHLLLNVLSVLMAFLLVLLFKNILTTFVPLIFTDSFQLIIVDVVGQLVHVIDVVEELAHELVVLLLAALPLMVM